VEKAKGHRALPFCKSKTQARYKTILAIRCEASFAASVYRDFQTKFIFAMRGFSPRRGRCFAVQKKKIENNTVEHDLVLTKAFQRSRDFLGTILFLIFCRKISIAAGPAATRVCLEMKWITLLIRFHF